MRRDGLADTADALHLERVAVYEGRLEVTVAGEICTLGPGDEVFIPKGVVHSVRNVHDATTRWLYGYD